MAVVAQTHIFLKQLPVFWHFCSTMFFRIIKVCQGCLHHSQIAQRTLKQQEPCHANRKRLNHYPDRHGKKIDGVKHVLPSCCRMCRSSVFTGILVKVTGINGTRHGSIGEPAKASDQCPGSLSKRAWGLLAEGDIGIHPNSQLRERSSYELLVAKKASGLVGKPFLGACAAQLNLHLGGLKNRRYLVPNG